MGGGGYNVFYPRRDAPSPEMPHIKWRSDYSGAWDLEFMQDISGKGASRLGVRYVSAGRALPPFRNWITGLGSYDVHELLAEFTVT